MSDWTTKYSSLELLEILREDLEFLDNIPQVDMDNTNASIGVVDALMERLENLPIPHDN